MPTEAEQKRKAELEKWLVKIDPDIAQKLRATEQWWDDEQAKDPGNKRLAALADKNRAAVLGDAKLESKREADVAAKAKADEAKQKADAAKQAAEDAKWQSKTETSPDAIQALVIMLEIWGDEKFLASRSAPQTMTPTKNALVDKLLAETSEVLKARNDIDKMGATIEKWHKLEKGFKLVLSGAREKFTPTKKNPKIAGSDLVLGIVPDGLAALESISRWMGLNHADYEEREAEKNVVTPDMSEKIALRDLEKAEPVIDALDKAISQGGDIAKQMNGAKLAKLTTFLKIWHSTHELHEKLEKFKEAGFGDQIKTVGDLVAFVVEQSNEAYSAFTEGAIALAKAKGTKKAVEALEGRLASLKKVATILAAYELVKSISDLVGAINKGDWHKIAEASYGVVSGTVAVAGTIQVEQTSISGIGTVTSKGAAVGVEASIYINMSAVAVWGAVESILLACDIIRWARAVTAMDAVKDMLADAKKILPDGKKMAAAADLLLKTEMGSTEYEAHEATVQRALPIVKKRITELYNYHLQDTSNPKIVGHYPELRTAFGKEAMDAGSGVSYPDDPFSQTKRFEIIIKAVKSVVDKGDATWGKEA